MRVISGIADLDFHFGSIAREGQRLIIRSRAGQAIATTVFVSSGDIVDAAKVLLRSPRALIFVLSAPFRRRQRSIGLAGEAPIEDDVNNPWL